MKWYQEKTFKFMFFGILTLMTTFTIGASIVDREFNPEAMYLFMPILSIGTLITYLKRNK